MTDKTYLTREFVSELIDKNQYIFVDDKSQDSRYLAKPLELMTDNSTFTLYWGYGVIWENHDSRYTQYYLTTDIKIISKEEADKLLKEWGIVL